MKPTRDFTTALPAVVLLSVTSLGGCMEHKVGTYTADETFRPAAVAALAKAACEGNVREVDQLIKIERVDPNAKGEQNITPLVWAITCENLQGIEALLKAGADPNYAVPPGHSPVYIASSYVNSNILELLLRYGGNPNSRAPNDARSSAWEAIMLGSHGHWENYDLLLKSGLNTSQVDDLGNTIADELVALDQWERVVDLLNSGYDHDLDRLARYTLLPDRDEPKQNLAKTRVRTMLEARDVVVPQR